MVHDGDMRRTTILYLYTEVMGYTLATIRGLVAAGAEIHLVHWDRGKLTPFQVQEFAGLILYPRSSLPNTELVRFAKKLAPDLAVVSGWQDRGYLPVARMLRRRGTPVVAGFDDQWQGRLRQRVAGTFGFLLQRYFSHAWVAGPRQFEYARRMGFSISRILHDLYSADLDVYDGGRRIGEPTDTQKLVFVGRLHAVKGLDLLLEAWRKLETERDGWELVVVGNGPLEKLVATEPGVTRRTFLTAADVREELASAAGFILPSRDEAWGVVLHEAAAAGLPLLCSSAVGAADRFLVHGHNGYVFPPDSVEAICGAVRRFIRLGADERARMGTRSREMSRRITPATSAANLLSILG